MARYVVMSVMLMLGIYAGVQLDWWPLQWWHLSGFSMVLIVAARAWYQWIWTAPATPASYDAEWYMALFGSAGVFAAGVMTHNDECPIGQEHER
jgi:lipid-A-disaccharide synthase-like uncharacterized protein